MLQVACLQETRYAGQLQQDCQPPVIAETIAAQASVCLCACTDTWLTCSVFTCCNRHVVLQGDVYNHCPAWTMAWHYRKRNLLKELLTHRPDIMCLQVNALPTLVKLCRQFSAPAWQLVACSWTTDICLLDRLCLEHRGVDWVPLAQLRFLQVPCFSSQSTAGVAELLCCINIANVRFERVPCCDSQGTAWLTSCSVATCVCRRCRATTSASTCTLS
jgi:hypothetical protein